VDQSGGVEVFDDRPEELRRDGQVKQIVAARAVGLVHLGELRLERVVIRFLWELPLAEPDVSGELRPGSLEVAADLLRQALVKLAAEVVVRPVAAGKPDDRVLRGQLPFQSKPVQRWRELAVGKIAGRPEKDHRARVGHSSPGEVGPKRIVIGILGRCHHWTSAIPPSDPAATHGGLR